MRNQQRSTWQVFGLVMALLASISWLVLPNRNSESIANAGPGSGNPLVGIWEMKVQGNATYHYKFAISEGTWVANGDVDLGFLGFRFSPTTGAYVKNSDGSYSYRERGWTYTRGGVCNGSFESTGTFELDTSGNTFSGPGVFKMFDLDGKTIFTETLTVVATKVSV